MHRVRRVHYAYLLVALALTNGFATRVAAAGVHHMGAGGCFARPVWTEEEVLKTQLSSRPRQMAPPTCLLRPRSNPAGIFMP